MIQKGRKEGNFVAQKKEYAVVRKILSRTICDPTSLQPYSKILHLLEDRTQCTGSFRV